MTGPWCSEGTTNLWTVRNCTGNDRASHRRRPKSSAKPLPEQVTRQYLYICVFCMHAHWWQSELDKYHITDKILCASVTLQRYAVLILSSLFPGTWATILWTVRNYKSSDRASHYRRPESSAKPLLEQFTRHYLYICVFCMHAHWWQSELDKYRTVDKILCTSVTLQQYTMLILSSLFAGTWATKAENISC